MKNCTDVITRRLINTYLKDEESVGNAREYLASQDLEGKWADVMYDNTSPTDWLANRHLHRLYDMAVAVIKSEGQSEAEKMTRGVIKGIEYWFKRKPVAQNWWFNQIGQQLKLGPILLMLKDKIPAELINTGAGYFYHPSEVKPGVTTGQNLMWFARGTITRGILTEDSEYIKQGFDYIKNEIKVSTKEGIQPDFSFYQHGAMLYNGGYGLGFMVDSSMWAAIARNTEYSFSSDKLDILAGLLLDGDRWMIRAKTIDPGIRGREISRKVKRLKSLALVDACDYLIAADSPRKEEIKTFKASILNETYSIKGNKHFWRTDYMTHPREKFYISVRMVSKRTNGTESLINENLKGFWLPFGFTCIMQSGNEYTDIYPVWDWARLPGVTCPHCVVPFTEKVVTQNEEFAGGVSDGIYGVAAMQVDKQCTRAQKAWFFFDDEFVALGTGITSEDENEVSTTLNQCLREGSVVINGKNLDSGEHVIEGPVWVHHDSIGYIIPDDSVVHIKAKSQTGSWNSVNIQYEAEDISMDVFSLWIEHGIRPENAGYQYIVVPAATEDYVRDYASNIHVKVLSNNNDIQAVSNESLGITGVVFYSAGTLSIDENCSISANAPCIVLINKSKKQISVADPTAKLESVTIGYHVGSEEEQLVFDLPSNGYAGSSVTKKLDIVDE